MELTEVHLTLIDIGAEFGIEKDDILLLTRPDLEQIFLCVRQQLATWRPDRFVAVKYPAGPWAAFKYKYFPNWLKKISPVRFFETRYEAVKVLQGFPIPLGDKVTQLDGFLNVPTVHPPDCDQDGSDDEPEQDVTEVNLNY